MVTYIDLIVFIGASICAFYGPLVFYLIYSRKKMSENPEEPVENPFESLFQGFSEHIATVILEGFDLESLKNEITVSVVAAMKNEIDVVVKNPAVLEEFQNFVKTAISGVLEEDLPEIIPPIIGAMFQQSQGQAPAEGQAPAAMGGAPDLSKVDMGDMVKAGLYQYIGNFLNNMQQNQTQSASAPAQITQGSKW